MSEFDLARRKLRHFVIGSTAGVAFGLGVGLGSGDVVHNRQNHSSPIQSQPAISESYDPLEGLCPSKEKFEPDTHVILLQGDAVKIGNSDVNVSFGELSAESEYESTKSVYGVTVSVDKKTPQERYYIVELDKLVDFGLGNELDLVGKGPRAYTTRIRMGCGSPSKPIRTPPLDPNLP